MQESLRTAAELYQYSCDHGYGAGFGLKWGLKNFGLLEKHLEPQEKVLVTFVGLHRFRSMSSHQRNFAYAVTDRHILMGQVRTFGRIRFESYPLSSIQNISFDYDSSIGVMKIALRNDAVTIGMSQETAQNLCQGMTQLLPTLQKYAQQSAEGFEEEDAEEESDD